MKIVTDDSPKWEFEFFDLEVMLWVFGVMLFLTALLVVCYYLEKIAEDLKNIFALESDMTILEMIAKATEIKEAVKRGDYLTAIRGFLALASAVMDSFAIPTFGAGPEGEKQVAELKSCLEECAAECDTVGAPGGRIFPGDGSFLKILIELFIKYAPIFLEPKPK